MTIRWSILSKWPVKDRRVACKISSSGMRFGTKTTSLVVRGFLKHITEEVAVFTDKHNLSAIVDPSRWITLGSSVEAARICLLDKDCQYTPIQMEKFTQLLANSLTTRDGFYIFYIYESPQYSQQQRR